MGIFDLFSNNSPTAKLIWGPWKLPFNQRQDNFLFIGSTGSGKTLGFILQYANILPRITPNGTQRAIIYDYKGDTLPILAALKKRKLLHPDVPIIPFNPFDSRSYSWDVATQLQSYSPAQILHATQRFVLALFPPKSGSGSSEFFHNHLTNLTTTTIQVLIDKKRPWSLSDVIDILYDKEKRTQLLSSHPEGRLALEHLGDEATQETFDASLAARLAPYRPLTLCLAMAAESNRQISISEFLTSPGILVLSGTNNPSEPLANLNRALFTHIVDALCNKPDTKNDYTWFFLDEVPRLGHLPSLKTLLRECRSKGASTFLGLQDIPSFYETIESKDQAEAILAKVTNLACFLLPDTASASWASGRCSHGTEQSKAPSSFRPADFHNLPQFSVKRGLSGIFLARDHDPQQATIKPLLLDNLTGP